MPLTDWQELLLVGAACDVGLFETIGRDKLTAAEIASTGGLDQRAVYEVCEALVRAGYLARRRNRYALTPESEERFLRVEGPDYLVNRLRHTRNQLTRWLSLPDVIRSGRPVSPRSDPAAATSQRIDFVRSMHDLARIRAPLIVDRLMEVVGTDPAVLDAGGGPGTIAFEMARRKASVTVLDLPDVVELVGDDYRDFPNIRLVGGDMTEKLPDGPFDLVLFSMVTHIFSRVANAALMLRGSVALKPGGVLAVVDFVRGRSQRAEMFAVNMLVATEEGSTYSEGDYRAWLEDAGLEDIVCEDLEAHDAQLIMGRRPRP